MHLCHMFQGSPGRPGAPGLPGLKGERGDPGELPFSLMVKFIICTASYRVSYILRVFLVVVPISTFLRYKKIFSWPRVPCSSSQQYIPLVQEDLQLAKCSL
jgi:hypothetical protein